MKITGQRVLLKVEPLKEKTSGGIIMPNSVVKEMNPSRIGIVEQLGDHDTFEVTVGEEVVYNAKMETKIDEDHVLIPQAAILYVRENNH